jgi:hypothetical protein
MNRRFHAVLLALALCRLTLSASPCDYMLDAPGDKWNAGLSREQDSTVGALVAKDKARYGDVEKQLIATGESRLIGLFAEEKPPADDKPFRPNPNQGTVFQSSPWIPDGFIVPSWRVPDISWNGFGLFDRKDDTFRAHFFKVGDTGGLVVFCYGSKGTVLDVMLVLKQDTAFIPLNGKSDYAARRDWEAPRLDKVCALIAQALKK